MAGSDTVTLGERNGFIRPGSRPTGSAGPNAAIAAAAFSGDLAAELETSGKGGAAFSGDLGIIDDGQWLVITLFGGDLIGYDEFEANAASLFATDLGRLTSWSPQLSGLQYRIYADTGLGDPIDYTTIIDSTVSLGWVSDPLTYPAVWKFGVRVYDPNSDLEEHNVDAVVLIR